ncbi:hypothetical protein JCM18750_02010 [Halostagnicola bangensis]
MFIDILALQGGEDVKEPLRVRSPRKRLFTKPIPLETIRLQGSPFRSDLFRATIQIRPADAFMDACTPRGTREFVR